MKDECLDIVDEKGNIIGKEKRSVLHKSPNRIHMTVNVLIVNSKREALVQQRSFKKEFGPGIWEVSAGGHVESGETPDGTARKELKEELGIDAELKFVAKKVYSFDNESELTHLYIGKSDGPFKLDKDEIERIKFVKFDDLEKFLSVNKEKSMLQYWWPVVLKNRSLIFEKLPNVKSKIIS